MAMEPAVISARPARTMRPVLDTAPLRPAARAKGTVKPSLMPITTSLMKAELERCCSECMSQYSQSLPDDSDTLQDLVFVDDQGRGQADLIAVRGLGEQAQVLQMKAKFPRCIRRWMRDHKGVQQTPAPDLADVRRIEAQQALPEELPHLHRIFDHMLILEDLQGRDGNL